MSMRTSQASTVCVANTEGRKAEQEEVLTFGRLPDHSFGFVDVETREPVCVPLGTTLMVEGLPPAIRSLHHLHKKEVVTYIASEEKRVPVFFFPHLCIELEVAKLLAKCPEAFHAKVINLPLEGPINSVPTRLSRAHHSRFERRPHVKRDISSLTA